MKIKIETKGFKELNKLLAAMPAETRKGIKPALAKVCADLKGKAQRIAPKKLGTLRGSAYYSVAVTNRGLEAEVGFTEVYALRQHEDLTYKHAKGTQAKFLSQPLQENEAKYVASISKAINDAIKGG